MNESTHTPALPARLAAAWPPERWREVHVLVAVSGGPDSMALLRAVVELKRRSGGAGQVLAGHVNHQLRGEGSDADQRWLSQQCRHLGLPLKVRRCDTAALAADEGDGIEAAARAARYRLLTEMAEAVGVRLIATGHTRDDQVETVLFRLLRGAGLRGLAGMPAVRSLSPAVSLVRPLLRCSRTEVLDYLASINQSYCEDVTNANVQFARNRLRRELLPYLREYFNVNVDGALERVAGVASEAQRLLETLAEPLLARALLELAPERGEALLDVSPLADQPEVLVCEALRRAWRDAGFGEQAMSGQWWRQLTQLAQSTADGGSLNLPGGVRATRAGGRLELRRRC